MPEAHTVEPPLKPDIYLRTYEAILGPWRNRTVNLLELGVHRGGSMFWWRDFFPAGMVAGIDLKIPPLNDPTGRIRLYEGMQQDAKLLDRVAAECAPEGFDLIIDDASHVGAISHESFWNLYPKHLRPGGIYVIEDWATGYQPSWPDGVRYQAAARPDPSAKRLPSHDWGLVGFVKQLVDECGAENPIGEEPRVGTIAEVRVRPGQVFLFKP
ncbi:MAG: hypothetical protein R2729_30975 [Bryobacteraceae bacterium]